MRIYLEKRGANSTHPKTERVWREYIEQLSKTQMSKMDTRVIKKVWNQMKRMLFPYLTLGLSGNKKFFKLIW